MPVDVAREVAALGRLSVNQLRERYAAAFGEATAARNRTWLVRRIAWRLQALAEGGLGERAKARAAELARDADLRVVPPPAAAAAAGPVPDHTPAAGDGRLPPPGTVLTRPYKGGAVRVRVLADGFEFGGAVYRSLSAAAKAATGCHLNGFAFFGLANKGGTR